MIKYSKHPNGDVISFREKDHKYYIEGKPSIKFTSGTTFINGFFQKFDTKLVSERYAAKHRLDPKQVRKEWKGRALRGKKYHAYAEEVFHDGPQSGDSDIFKIIDKKFKSLYRNGYIPVACEKIIASPPLRVAGPVDLIMGKGDTLLISDWKFVGEIVRHNIWQNAHFPIQHLPDCNFYKYVLQLNLYKYIIRREKYFPEYKKHKLEIYHIREDGLEVITVPTYINSIKQMLAYSDE